MERNSFDIWKTKALTDSALDLLPSYKMQLTDAMVIFCIMNLSSLVCNVYLQTQSVGVMMNALSFIGITISCIALWLYMRFMPIFLKAGDKTDFYIGAFLEYLIVTIGYSPLYLYLFVELKWFMLNKYGCDCLFLFNTYTNWLLAGMAFATISCVYWLIVHLIQKESKMFYLLEKKKKETIRPCGFEVSFFSDSSLTRIRT